MNYDTDELLVLGKRLNNSKRTYLLIDPLQAKHIPVSPTAALDMMAALGSKVRECAPDAGVVIGFAETATAIGGAVALCLGRDTVYLTTTREDIPSVKSWVEFREEHSHAADQKIAADRLDELFSSTGTIVFVDDELSTGKTLVNMAEQLRRQFPSVSDRRIIAASVINRLTDENTEMLASYGIECVSLLRIANEDYSSEVLGMDVSAAVSVTDTQDSFTSVSRYRFADPRTGVDIGGYFDLLERIAADYIGGMPEKPGSRTAVIGTEEAMLPALILGRTLERVYPELEVCCHSTTRSPIGISDSEGYPIYNGFSFSSFYENSRTTFLYDIAGYDTVIIITDAAGDTDSAAGALCKVFSEYGCRDIRLIKGDNNVQYI